MQAANRSEASVRGEGYVQRSSPHQPVLNMKRRNGYNPKRRIAPVGTLPADQCQALSRKVTYGGNPEHKRSPGNYGLTPPAQPRPGKTLCDGVRDISRHEAIALLKAGLLKGMFNQCEPNEWPQNVWAVSTSGEVFEAHLENREKGTYHGYPVPEDDDFRQVIQQEWAKR